MKSLPPEDVKLLEEDTRTTCTKVSVSGMKDAVQDSRSRNRVTEQREKDERVVGVEKDRCRKTGYKKRGLCTVETEKKGKREKGKNYFYLSHMFYHGTSDVERNICSQDYTFSNELCSLVAITGSTTFI